MKPLTGPFHRLDIPAARRQPPRPGAEPQFFSTQVSSARRFFLDLAPAAGQRLAVVCGGVEHCDAAYHVERTDFDYRSLEFVARGRGLLRLANTQHELAPGAAFAYGPGVYHEICSDPQNPLVKYFVDFSGRAASRLLAAPAPRPGELVQTSAPDQILRVFEDLITTGLQQTRWTRRLCAAILEQLLLRVAETAVPASTIGSLAFETYQHCRQFIESSYLQTRKLSDVAECCGVSDAYLCRLYGRFDHQTPYQHLMRLKMRHAAQRLETSGTLAKQVAAELGFSDPFQFSRTFRRIMGLSPRQFISMRRPAPV